MMDLDALDILERLHLFADDRVELVDQAQAGSRAARLEAEHVLRLVHRPYTLGIDLVAQPGGQ